MAGRKKLPSNLKLLKGTYQNCRENKNEIKPPPEIPTPPDHLSKEALLEWNRITIELHTLGLLSQISRSAIAAYCQCYGRWAQAEKMINKAGLLSKTTNGNIIQSPIVGVANRALDLMHKYITEFGMTPASAPKVSGNKKEPEKKSRFSKIG